MKFRGREKIHVDKLLSVAMNTPHYFDVKSLVNYDLSDENGFIDIQQLLDKAEEVSPYRKVDLVYEVGQMIKKLDVSLDEHITDEKQELNVVKVRLVPDVPLYSNKAVSSPDIAVEVLQKELATYDREIFGVLNLDTKGHPINFNIVSMGTLDSSLVHPREIFKSTILSNAHSFIAIHNHPSGIAIPSKEDITSTARLYEASKILGVEMKDHIIVANDDIYSFAQNNILGISHKEAEALGLIKEEAHIWEKQNQEEEIGF